MMWREKLDDWHSIFCWQPHRIGDQWIWLERIERRRKLETWVGDVFEYRLRDSDGTAKAALNEDLAVPDYPPEEPRVHPLPSPESAERPGWPAKIAIVDVEVRKTGPNRYRAEAA